MCAEKISTFVTLAALFALIVGCAVLAGWLFNVATLKSLLPGIVSMNLKTAIKSRYLM